MANVYIKSGRYSNEANDCSVISLAYAFDVRYEVAHEVLRTRGRKPKKGFNFYHIFGLSVDESAIFQVMGTQYKVTRFPKPKMKLHKFKVEKAKGTYMINVSGHVFTMIDGKLFNQNNLRQNVSDYYKVEKIL